MHLKKENDFISLILNKFLPKYKIIRIFKAIVIQNDYLVIFIENIFLSIIPHIFINIQYLIHKNLQPININN
jgi:hypothetical protein